jgi:DNA repair protein RecO (recombination protein O)
MKSVISPSIVMRTKRFGESDLLVDFFTSDQGRLKGIAKGALRSRKRFVNCFDSFSLAKLEFGEKRKGDLCFLESGRLIHAYPGLRSELSVLYRASYMVELTEILFPWGLPEREMFELLCSSFEILSDHKMLDILPIIFEIKAMSLGGYAINFEKCCVCGRLYQGEGRALLKREQGGITCLKCEKESHQSPGLGPETVNTIMGMRTRPLKDLIDLNVAPEILREIRPALKIHREYHLGKIPKTVAYLE